MGFKVMILQPRDQKLFAALARFGVLSTRQIQELFFPGISHTTLMKRLRLLEKGNYIGRGVTLKNQTHTWILSRGGRRLTKTGNLGTFTNRNTIDHDILITQVRIKLESFGLAQNWVPEFQMKSEVFRKNRYQNAKSRLIPDGISIEPVSKVPHAIAMEIELTRKSKLRYKRIFDQYAGKNALGFIWYFVPSIKDAQVIYKVSQKSLSFRDSHRLLFSVLGEFLESQNPEIFSVRANKWMKLSEFGFDHFKLHETAPTQGVSNQGIKNISIETTSNPANSCTNSQNTSSLRAEPSAADHSPSTMESGQQLQANTNNKKSELVQELELKKCG
jgi:hypothetical protein